MRRPLSYLTILCIVVLSLAVVFCSCDTSNVDDSPGQTGDTITVVDQAGREVEIPSTVNRIAIVHGACNVPEILSVIGAGERLVGGLCSKRGEEDIQLKVEPHYETLESIKPDASGACNIEELVNLAPDVVIVWENVTNIEQIEAVGIPVIVMNVSDWDTTLDFIELLGTIVDKEAKAQEVIDYWNSMAADIAARTSDLTQEQQKKVLFIVSSDPLTVMGNSSHNRYMIERAGGINATNEFAGHYVEISLEQVLVMDPDVILIMAGKNQVAEFIAGDSAWAAARAVQNNDYYVSPYGAFLWDKPCAETPLFLLWEAHVLYPDIFSQSELEEETKSFFEDFFDYELTEDELGQILYSN